MQIRARVQVVAGNCGPAPRISVFSRLADRKSQRRVQITAPAANCETPVPIVVKCSARRDPRASLRGRARAYLELARITLAKQRSVALKRHFVDNKTPITQSGLRRLSVPITNWRVADAIHIELRDSNGVHRRASEDNGARSPIRRVFRGGNAAPRGADFRRQCVSQCIVFRRDADLRPLRLARA